MTDVVISGTTSASSSIVGVDVAWSKNGGAAVNVAHTIGNPNQFFSFTYLNDVPSAVTAPGDVIAATVWEVDGSGNTSTVVVPAPASVTIPNAPPLPPVNVTLVLK